MKKVLLFGFLCGALAVIVFHQGTVYVLFHQFPLIKAVTGLSDAFRPVAQGFSLRTVPPLGAPQVVWMALWGGVWGILLAGLIRWARMPDLMTGFLVGMLTTLVGFIPIAQWNGTPVWGGGGNIALWSAALLNGAWGWGAAMLMRPFSLRG